MSKFRARQLDATKPIAIYFQEDISDSTEFNNVTNRTVPQLPTGMEKEEETEHHLQQAIFHQRVIPVPEVFSWVEENDKTIYGQLYPTNYKLPRQMVHIHPFSTDQDIPDYDMDSEDEKWLDEHTKKGELLPIDASQFEEMMDCLEKASGLKAVTLQEAKLLLKDDDDLITTVFDYWLNKRLRLQHPLVPQVRSDKVINSATSDPYIAFRKRTEKMQTRKNRKNDETSYEKMLKLRRDLIRAVNLLEMVKKREGMKRELLHKNIEVHEKRYEMEDFSGAIINEINAQRLSQQISRSVFSPLVSNHQNTSLLDSDLGSDLWLKVPSSRANKDEGKRERRAYRKKRKHLHQHFPTSSSSSTQVPKLNSSLSHSYSHPPDPFSIASLYPQTNMSGIGVVSEDEFASHSESEDDLAHDGVYGFRRRNFVNYHAPREPSERAESPPFCRRPRSPGKHFYMTSLSHPTERMIGLARRRIGRGGRIWIDRIRHPLLDTRLKNETKELISPGPSLGELEYYPEDVLENLSYKWPHFYPKLPVMSTASSSRDEEDSEDADIDVETVVPPSPVSVIADNSYTTDTSSNRLSGIENNIQHNFSTSSCTANSTSSFYITAEVLEGSDLGSLTDLRVSLPPSPSDTSLFDCEGNVNIRHTPSPISYNTGSAGLSSKDVSSFQDVKNNCAEKSWGRSLLLCSEGTSGGISRLGSNVKFTSSTRVQCSGGGGGYSREVSSNSTTCISNSTNSDNCSVSSSNNVVVIVGCSASSLPPPPPYTSSGGGSGKRSASVGGKFDCDIFYSTCISTTSSIGSKFDSSLTSSSPICTSISSSYSTVHSPSLEHQYNHCHKRQRRSDCSFQTQPTSTFSTKDSCNSKFDSFISRPANNVACSSMQQQQHHSSRRVGGLIRGGVILSGSSSSNHVSLHSSYASSSSLPLHPPPPPPPPVYSSGIITASSISSSCSVSSDSSFPVVSIPCSGTNFINTSRVSPRTNSPLTEVSVSNAGDCKSVKVIKESNISCVGVPYAQCGESISHLSTNASSKSSSSFRDLSNDNKYQQHLSSSVDLLNFSNKQQHSGNNGNNLLNSNLVSRSNRRIISSSCSSDSVAVSPADVVLNNDVLSNGPSSKSSSSSLEKFNVTKCGNITPVIYPET